METLEVTDEQYAFIQQLREEISRRVVGPYGYVRGRDAVQFLIDNLDGDVEVDVEFTGSATDDVAASVDRELAGERTVSYEEAGLVDGEPLDVDPSATDGEAETDDEEGEADDVDEDEGADDEGAEVDREDDVDDGDEEADGEIGEDDEEAEADDDGETDDDMLDRMMSLLETHEDKWGESPTADYRYRVDLPDGTTEDVQTKDDVRALLFKNY